MTDQNPFGVNVIRRQIAAPGEMRAGALSVPAVVPAQELQIHDMMFREAARNFPGAGEVMFEDDDSPEEWEEVPGSIGAISQAQKWQRIMSWPRLPTFDEAQQWQASASAEAFNALAERLAAFRANWSELEALAKLGGIEFWRGKMSLPADQRGKALGVYDIAMWLAEASLVAIAAWQKELGD